MRPIVRDRVAWSVCRSVCHTSEPCKNGWTDRHAVWVEDLGGPKGHVLDGGSDPPWEGAMLRGKDVGRLATPRGGKWARPPLVLWWHYRPRGTSEFVVTRGAMRPFVKLLWPLVNIYFYQLLKDLSSNKSLINNVRYPFFVMHCLCLIFCKHVLFFAGLYE